MSFLLEEYTLYIYICKILYEIAKGSWFMESRLRILELEEMEKHALNNNKNHF